MINEKAGNVAADQMRSNEQIQRISDPLAKKPTLTSSESKAEKSSSKKANIKGIIVGICTRIVNFMLSSFDDFIHSLGEVLKNTVRSAYKKRTRVSYPRRTRRPISTKFRLKEGAIT